MTKRRRVVRAKESALSQVERVKVVDTLDLPVMGEAEMATPVELPLIRHVDPHNVPGFIPERKHREMTNHEQDLSRPAPSMLKSGISDGTTKAKEYGEIPMAVFDELIDRGTPEVALRLQRRSTQGRLMTIGGTFVKPTPELYEVEAWVSTNWGGGNYRIEARDTQNLRMLLFVFNVALEGAPKLHQSPPPNSPPGTMGPPILGIPPSERSAMGNAAPFAQYSSDQVLAAQIAARDEELAKFKERAEREADERERRLKLMETELAAAREAQREAQATGRVAALEARLEALKDRPAPEPKTNWMETVMGLAPVIAALAPIAQSFIGSRSDEAKRAADSQTALMTTLVSVMNKPQPDTTKDLITTLGPMMLPLLTKAIEGRNPADQVGIYQAMADNNLNTIGMMAQLIEASAPPPESAAGQAIRVALEGLQNVASAYIRSQAGLPGQGSMPPQPVGVLRNAPSVYDNGSEAEVVDAPAPRRAPRVDPTLEALFGLLPSEFQSREWRFLLTQLHTEPPPDADELAAQLAGHLESLINMGMLPPVLASLTENPRNTLEAIIERLPVAAKNPGYAKAVLDSTLAMLAQDGYGPQPSAEDSEDSEEGAESEAGDEAE